MAYRGKREKRAQERKGERETSSLVHGSFSGPTRESGVPFFGIYSYAIQISNRNYSHSTVKTDPETVTPLTETPLRHKCFIMDVWKRFSA